MKTYPIAAEYKKHSFYAISTNQFRRPKKGEWYLSGAIVEAYRAENDLSIEFMIVKLVEKIPAPLSVKDENKRFDCPLCSVFMVRNKEEKKRKRWDCVLCKSYFVLVQE